MSIDQILVSSDLGGAGLFALRIADELRRRSQASRVWLPGEGAAAREAYRLELDVRMYPASLLSSVRSRWETVIGNFKLWRDLPTGGRNLVHVHSPSAYRSLLPSLLLSRMRNVVHVQIEESAETLRWAFRRPPDLIITCANYLVETVRRALPRSLQEPQWIEAVPNAVDTRRFAPGDKRDAKRRVGGSRRSSAGPHAGQSRAAQRAGNRDPSHGDSQGGGYPAFVLAGWRRARRAKGIRNG